MLKTRPAGISAAAFAVLTVVAAILESPPGGNYSQGDVDSFISSGHRPLVLAGVYVAIAAGIALMSLVLQVYRATAPGPRQLVVAGAGALAAVAFPIGLAVSAAVPIGLMVGGSKAPVPASGTTFAFSQAGNAVTMGVGATCLGIALIAGAVAFTGWLRVSAYVAGVCGVLSPAWFPFLLMLLWTLVAGIVLAARTPRPEAITLPGQTRTEAEAPTRVS